MLCGAHPFDLEGNSPENEVTDRVRTTTVPLEGLGDEISDSAKDLISRCGKLYSSYSVVFFFHISSTENIHLFISRRNSSH